jgi:hypothetical protein
MPANTKKFAPQIAFPRATRKNELWATEIVLRDDSQRTQILIVLDVFSGLPVVLTVLDSRPETAVQLVTHLNEASRGVRYPETLWVDRSFEFGSEELTDLADRMVDILYGDPVRKRSVTERFLRRLARFLSENASLAPDNLNQNLAEWRQRYKVAAE